MLQQLRRILQPYLHYIEDMQSPFVLVAVWNLFARFLEHDQHLSHAPVGIFTLEADVIVQEAQRHWHIALHCGLELGVQRFAFIVRENHRVGANWFAAQFGLFNFDFALSAEKPIGELLRVFFREPLAESVACATGWFGW
ncbi:MAG: hypothetical protein ACREEM_09640 [Blastocatellia bacterium]